MDAAKLYRMEHYSIVAPKVTNDGYPSGYPAALREALLTYGIDGWTETHTEGVWRGKMEAGVTFDVYLMPSVAPPSEKLGILGRRARAAMPDQEAVQVAYHGTVLLHEG